METDSPRQLKLFDPSFGGDVSFQDIGDPLEFDSEGIANGGESLAVQFKQPDGSTGLKKFYVGFDIFLDDNGSAPPNNHPLSNVPDDQLMACISMGAILAGEVHPGSKEFLTQIASDQNVKNFQTILLDVKLKSVQIVDESELLPGQLAGTFYDVTFMRTGQSGNTKTVRSDVTSIASYAKRKNSYTLAACCAPGSITKEFGKKTVTDLGSAGSQLRIDICDFLKAQRFYA